MVATRPASHANQWYEADPETLAEELRANLDKVPDTIDGVSLPVPGARVIIAPHASYYYSGPNAAWAYKAFDLSRAKRVFVLGPSHKYSLVGCALTSFAKYATPFGDLQVDEAVVRELRATGEFGEIPKHYDVSEHCLEMHMPYIWLRLEQTRGRDAAGRPGGWPTIVPILVGGVRRAAEKRFGALLLPYLRDPENAFVVSSDFCHWGDCYDYQAYYTKSPDADGRLVLTSHDEKPFRRSAEAMPLHESIRLLDEAAIRAIESGVHDRFVANLAETHNTVCGRHPIGVVMAALEALRAEKGGGEADEGRFRFKFIKYDRSNDITDASKYSVSYASAYAVL